MKSRAILLGMNSATGEALALYPNTGAGRRLFDLTGYTEEEYAEKFDRINLLDDTEWDCAKGKASAKAMRYRVAGRRVVVLGNQAWSALGLPKANWFQEMTVGDTVWYLIPHPSGKNLLYNKPSVREKARNLLRSIQ